MMSAQCKTGSRYFPWCNSDKKIQKAEEMVTCANDV